MRDYSHGMKRKLGLLQALMTDPPVLDFGGHTSRCWRADEIARGTLDPATALPDTATAAVREDVVQPPRGVA